MNIMPTDPDLLATSAPGYDRSLSQNGDDRFYWYSVKDMMSLLVNARKDYLRYEDAVARPIFGEEYSPLRQNYQQLLIADPYDQINFATYLAGDIDKIIGDGDRMFLRDSPVQIIIPLLCSGYWRAIKIHTFFLTKTVSILWDDPYGEGAFPQTLKDTLLEAIIPNANRLIVAAVGDSEFRLSLDDVVQVDKSPDQQGKGGNAWDCGPIMISNITDYIKNWNIENTSVYKYSISDSSHADHEQQMTDARNLHREQYNQISCELLNEDRLFSIIKDEIHSAKAFINKVESFPRRYQQQIAVLSPSKVNILLALIDSNRQSQERIEEYSIKEVVKALEYFHHRITPISAEYFNVDAINDLLERKRSDFNQLSFEVGTDAFSEITANGRDYVDKSLFIKEIIETRDKVAIITRPRRWGKTTNMTMLYNFFSIEVNEIDNSIVTSRYRELFQHLRIGQEYPDLLEEHQGTHPVIFFTFKNLVSKKYRKIKSMLKKDIKILYKKYDYLYNSNKLDDDQKKQFRKYENGHFGSIGLESSLHFLSSLLKAHHGKEVYIFIDEYDAPLNATYDTEEYEKTLLLMRSMLGKALKGNDNLKKSVVTGVTKIAKAGLFSDVNNPEEYSILDNEYAEYFGFTEAEVQSLL